MGYLCDIPLNMYTHTVVILLLSIKFITLKKQDAENQYINKHIYVLYNMYKWEASYQ